MLLVALLWSLLAVVSSQKGHLSKQCRELLQCSVRKNCIKTSFLNGKFQNESISAQMYDDLTVGIDYACIFNSGCNEECNACHLCFNSKMQLTDILSGTLLSDNTECHELVNCASQCVIDAGGQVEKMYDCLLKGCAFHCFDGGCAKCSSFTTRIFNQACVSSELRQAVKGFKGQCFEMFKQIVYLRFKPQFDAIGKRPVIGHQN